MENVESGESIIKSIYKKYFRHKNLDLKEKFVDDSVLAQIENDYRKRPLNKNMYDEAFRHATTYLRPCYQNFFKSDIFINYVQSLKKEEYQENYVKANSSNLEEEACSRTFDKSNSEILECGVCNNYFGSQGDRIPRLLSCGHTFCHSCLDHLCHKQNLSNYCNNENQTTEIFCPFDRQPTQLGPNGILDLKRNFALLDLIGNSRDTTKSIPPAKSIQIPLDPFSSNNNLPKIPENFKVELSEAKPKVKENNEFKIGGETCHLPLNPYINMDEENTNNAVATSKLKNSRPPVKAISTLNYIGKKHAFKKYDKFALNNICFCAISRNFC